MKEISAFILLLTVGMFIVSSRQSKELTRLSPLLEKAGEKKLSLKFRSFTGKMLSTGIGNVEVCARSVFNEFQF
ncbi:MAG TPA: hypothetical protein VL859_01290 [Flavobacterium sp.]|nr:hypothetical protein [Flavobacterium sp.]